MINSTIEKLINVKTELKEMKEEIKGLQDASTLIKKFRRLKTLEFTQRTQKQNFTNVNFYLKFKEIKNNANYCKNPN